MKKAQADNNKGTIKITIKKMSLLVNLKQLLG